MGTRWLLRWAVIAVVVGAMASLTTRALILTVSLASSLLVGRAGPFIAPFLGAVVVFAILRVQPQIAGPGTDNYIQSARNRDRSPGMALGLYKILATALTVGSGGSGGLIGPSLLIGSSTARPIRSIMPGVEEDGPDFLPVVGAAAMMGALLGAPIAGGLLAAEIIYRSSLDYRALLPAVLGSTAGSLSYGLMWGIESRITPLPAPPGLTNLAGAVAVAALAALSGVVLILALAGVRTLANRWVGWLVIPGGAATGLLAWAAGPQILGWGVPEVLQSWIQGLGPDGGEALVLLPAKILATAFTVGTGGSGGVIGPALVLGSLSSLTVLGLVGGCLVALSASGMAASLAAVSNVPLAAAVLMVEWLGPAAAPYAALGAVTGFAIGRSRVAYTSYEERRRSRRVLKLA